MTQFHDRYRAVRPSERFVAFRPVAAMTSAGPSIWMIEATGASREEAERELERIIREWM